ncbi:Uncharacterised protein [uncultured archaeon]|nr:Uncharacterised protein [uncultured archaeon]
MRNRIPPDELKKVIEWCEKRKLEEGRAPLIEMNPFKDMEWLRNKTVIQIDRPRESSDQNGVLYDSTLRALFEWVNGVWKRIE